MLRILSFASILHIATALLAPTDLAVKETTHSLNVTWESQDRRAVYFEARIAPLDSGETVEQVQWLRQRHITWNDLIPGKTYNVTISAIASDGSQSPPAKVSVVTRPMPPYQIRLSNFIHPVLKAYQMGHGRTMMYPIYGGVVMWDGPDSGLFDDFNVKVDPPHGMVRTPIVRQGAVPVANRTSKRRIVWDLMPGVLYTFGTSTVSSGIESETVNISRRLTPEVPAEIKVQAITPVAVSLSWNQPHRGVLDNFIVEVDPVEGSRVLEPSNLARKERVIADLTPGSVYNVDVYSVSAGVWSHKPRSITIKTPPAAPLKPVISTDVTLNSLTVSWQRPKGRLDYYEVVYWPTLNDKSRLRHRIKDTSVTLTALEPDTQYSLLIFSVSNTIHSVPLRDFVRTGSFATTPAPTSKKSLATMAFREDTTAAEEDGGNITALDHHDGKRQPQFNFSDRIEVTTANTIKLSSTSSTSSTKSDPVVRVGELTSTSLSSKKSSTPGSLPAHHSIPYTMSPIETFPTTVYYEGRVTQSPTVPVNTDLLPASRISTTTQFKATISQEPVTVKSHSPTPITSTATSETMLPQLSTTTSSTVASSVPTQSSSTIVNSISSSTAGNRASSSNTQSTSTASTVEPPGGLLAQPTSQQPTEKERAATSTTTHSKIQSTTRTSVSNPSSRVTSRLTTEPKVIEEVITTTTAAGATDQSSSSATASPGKLIEVVTTTSTSPMPTSTELSAATSTEPPILVNPGSVAATPWRTQIFYTVTRSPTSSPPTPPSGKTDKVKGSTESEIFPSSTSTDGFKASAAVIKTSKPDNVSPISEKASTVSESSPGGSSVQSSGGSSESPAVKSTLSSGSATTKLQGSEETTTSLQTKSPKPSSSSAQSQNTVMTSSSKSDGGTSKSISVSASNTVAPESASASTERIFTPSPPILVNPGSVAATPWRTQIFYTVTRSPTSSPPTPSGGKTDKVKGSTESELLPSSTSTDGFKASAAVIKTSKPDKVTPTSEKASTVSESSPGGSSVQPSRGLSEPPAVKSTLSSASATTKLQGSEKATTSLQTKSPKPSSSSAQSQSTVMTSSSKDDGGTSESISVSASTIVAPESASVSTERIFTPSPPILVNPGSVAATPWRTQIFYTATRSPTSSPPTVGKTFPGRGSTDGVAQSTEGKSVSSSSATDGFTATVDIIRTGKPDESLPTTAKSSKTSESSPGASDAASPGKWSETPEQKSTFSSATTTFVDGHKASTTVGTNAKAKSSSATQSQSAVVTSSGRTDKTSTGSGKITQGPTTFTSTSVESGKSTSTTTIKSDNAQSSQASTRTTTADTKTPTELMVGKTTKKEGSASTTEAQTSETKLSPATQTNTKDTVATTEKELRTAATSEETKTTLSSGSSTPPGRVSPSSSVTNKISAHTEQKALSTTKTEGAVVTSTTSRVPADGSTSTIKSEASKSTSNTVTPTTKDTKENLSSKTEPKSLGTSSSKSMETFASTTSAATEGSASKKPEVQGSSTTRHATRWSTPGKGQSSTSEFATVSSSSASRNPETASTSSEFQPHPSSATAFSSSVEASSTSTKSKTAATTTVKDSSSTPTHVEVVSTEDKEVTAGGTTTPQSSTATVPVQRKTIPIKSGYETICKADNITILVDKKVIGLYEKQFGPLHLNDYDDPACRGVEHETYYRYTIAPNILACGTSVELNDTHVNFTNVVSNSRQRLEWEKRMNQSTGTVLVGRTMSRFPMLYVHMNIWCTFPLDVNVSVPFLPEMNIQMITFNVSGRGQFSALMQLYKTSAYISPYVVAPKLEVDDTLHVGVSLLESQDPSTFLVVKRCWATPERSPGHSVQYSLIEESCSVPGSLDGTVRIVENGVSKRARWEGSVFKFVNFEQVWLHCSIQVCFGNGCQKDCSNPDSRVRRSEDKPTADYVLSAGPIIIGNTVNKTTEPSKTDTTAASNMALDKTTVLILVIVLSAVILLCLIVIACVVARLRRQRMRNKNVSPAASPSHLSSAPFDSQSFQLSSAESGQTSVPVSRANSSMSTFRSERGSRSRPPISTLSSGGYGNDNAGFFSSTTELTQAQDSEDFPAPPPELLDPTNSAASTGGAPRHYQVLT